MQLEILNKADPSDPDNRKVGLWIRYGCDDPQNRLLVVERADFLDEQAALTYLFGQFLEGFL